MDWGYNMRKYTERLDIKMTPEDMQLLAVKSLKAGMPLTVYARELIIKQLNPMLVEGQANNAISGLDKDKSGSVAD